jgi:SAM-dependent methyltransferase
MTFVDPTTRANQIAWDAASQKYLSEYDDFLAEAATGSTLRDTERSILGGGLERALGVPCRYIVAVVPEVPLEDSCADLVYTGKGALIWMPDLEKWAREVVRLLKPLGHLFIYEAHPAVPLWTWDTDHPRIRADRGYFDRSHVNDTFPGNGAVEWQWNLGQIVTTLVAAGMEILHLGEYAEPFWRAGGLRAAAWEGRLPNTFSLLARRR